MSTERRFQKSAFHVLAVRLRSNKGQTVRNVSFVIFVRWKFHPREFRVFLSHTTVSLEIIPLLIARTEETWPCLTKYSKNPHSPLSYNQPLIWDDVSRRRCTVIVALAKALGIGMRCQLCVHIP